MCARKTHKKVFISSRCSAPLMGKKYTKTFSHSMKEMKNYNVCVEWIKLKVLKVNINK